MLQLDHVLHCPAVAFDLLLGLPVIRSILCVSHLTLAEILPEFAGQICRTVVAQQSRTMSHSGLVHAREAIAWSSVSLTSVAPIVELSFHAMM